VSAKARLAVDVQNEYTSSLVDQVWQYLKKKNHDRGSVTLTEIKVKNFLRADGSIEPNKAYASGANIVLKLFTNYFEEMTVENFSRIK